MTKIHYGTLRIGLEYDEDIKVNVIIYKSECGWNWEIEDHDIYERCFKSYKQAKNRLFDYIEDHLYGYIKEQKWET